MYSDNSAKAEGLVGLGVFLVVGAIILVIYRDPVRSIGYIVVVAGTALCGWGFVCLAKARELQLSEGLRWVLVPVAAIGAYLVAIMLASGLCGIISYILSKSSPQQSFRDPLRFLFLLVVNVSGSYGAVSAGARTAPEDRFTIAVVLAVAPLFISTAMLGVMIVATFGMVTSMLSTPLPWFIAWVSGLLATIVACAQVHRQESIGTSDPGNKHENART